MHKDVMPAALTGPNPTVWQPWHFNLGDHWATVNHLITRSYATRREQLLSRWQHGKDYGPRFEEMLSLIRGPERSQVTLVDLPYNTELDGFDVWASPAWPTSPSWDPAGAHEGIVYQFDGISSAEAKNPPTGEASHMLTELGRLDDLTRLGSHLSLRECVEVMCGAKVFVGVDSGMSHIAHSAGIPMVLIEYKMPIITCHRRKHFHHARGTQEAIAAVRRIYGG